LLPLTQELDRLKGATRLGRGGRRNHRKKLSGDQYNHRAA
jgi:hypothetical protein